MTAFVEPYKEREPSRRAAPFFLLSLPLTMNHRQTICERRREGGRGEKAKGELGNWAITIAIILCEEARSKDWARSGFNFEGML